MVSLSVEADASAVTVSGALPEVGLTASAATGGESDTVTLALLVEARPAVSVTVTDTVKVPAPL